MKIVRHFLKLLTENKHGQTRKLCRGFCLGTQLSPNQDDSTDEFSMVSPRIRLRDGRNLAYVERGVPKDKATYKIIIVHGFGSSKEMNFLAPQELIDELGIYLLQYDRAGYGESDPNPKRSLKSEALDIEELADQLQIGANFYVIGVSMGSYATWSCLKYLPHRLAGLALIAPVINYRWPSLPGSLVREDYRRRFIKWALWLANHCPKLLHWWVTQKWLPSTAVIEKNPTFFNKNDIDILKTIPGFPMLSKLDCLSSAIPRIHAVSTSVRMRGTADCRRSTFFSNMYELGGRTNKIHINKDRLREQVVFDTLRHDWRVAFGKWEFDPMKLSNPFPNKQSSFHIWHGYEDKVVPSELQRFVSGKLPWIQYHEVHDGGHLIIYYKGLCEAILKALLLGQENHAYKPKSSLLIKDECYQEI